MLRKLPLIMTFRVSHAHRLLLRAAASACISGLAACGGGGASSSSLPLAASAPGTLTVPPSSAAPVSSLAPVTAPTSSSSSSPAAPTASAPVIAPLAAAAGSTLGRIALQQAFDFHMTNAQRTAAASRYDTVWGTDSPRGWTAGHASIGTGYYTAMEAPDTTHSVAWYQANHPDWVVYNCTSAGTPTRIPAYLSGYGAAPLDLRNPAAAAFVVRSVLAPLARANGYNALSFDQVVFRNITGGNAGAGSYGCGVYENGTFVRRYSSKTDPAWATDTVNWVKTVKGIIAADGDNLKVEINHPAGSIANPLEQQLLTAADATLDEDGFSYYGSYKAYGVSGFTNALNYIAYAQSVGHTALLIDKFIQSGALSALQREWVVATYLIANTGHAMVYATSTGDGGYGYEHYLPEYGTNLGMPCAAYVRDARNPNLFSRRFQNGMVALNAGATGTVTAALPAGHVFRDIEGRGVGALLVIPPTDAFVMTTAAGTGCL